MKVQCLQPMIGCAATQLMKDINAVLQSLHQIIKRLDGGACCFCKFINIRTVRFYVLDCERFIRTKRRYHSETCFLRSELFVILKGIRWIIRCADDLHVVPGEKILHGKVVLLQHSRAGVVDLFCGRLIEKYVYPEVVL